ncbi:MULTISPECIES: hypothetical protein [unclassified Streptomyces]|uniref:hypothetical protein n=1 Tax=unclassified Streptomyces TaxID=2593676 RepID=UPI002E2F0F67|nr:hypothetical protein [Streptomyces sp. NBC_01268]
MNHATPLRRTLSALAATTLLAGGLLLGQTATAPAAQAAGKPVVCNVPKMRQESHALRVKAAKLQNLGAKAEARKARAQADALDRRIKSCVDADDHAQKPFPG